MININFILSSLISLAILAVLLFFGESILATLPLSLHTNMPYAMVGGYGFALFVSWLYRKSSHYFFLIFFLPIALILVFDNATWLSGQQAPSTQTFIVFFLSINLLFFSLIKNKSVMNRASLKWWAWIIVQWILLYAVTKSALIFPLNLDSGLFQVISSITVQHESWLLTDIEKILIAVTCLYLLLYLGIKRTALDVSLALFYGLFVIAIVNQSNVVLFSSIVTASLFFYLMLMFFESYRLAYYDELTMLPSRRALHEAIKTLGSRYVIAMLDIDHFKRINDRHGHDVGDQVLRFIASKIDRNMRGGRVFRYGGEEFMLVFPGKNLQKTEVQLESLRKKIETESFNLRRKNKRLTKGKKEREKHPDKRRFQHIKLTVSIGVAEKGEASSPEMVMKQADKGVYKAKRTGRNKVVTMPA